MSNVQIEKGVGAFLASIKTWMAIISIASLSVLAVLVLAATKSVTPLDILTSFGLVYGYHVAVRNSHYFKVMLFAYGLAVAMALANYNFILITTILVLGVIGAVYRWLLKRTDISDQ